MDLFSNLLILLSADFNQSFWLLLFNFHSCIFLSRNWVLVPLLIHHLFPSPPPPLVSYSFIIVSFPPLRSLTILNRFLSDISLSEVLEALIVQTRCCLQIHVLSVCDHSVHCSFLSHPIHGPSPSEYLGFSLGSSVLPWLKLSSSRSCITSVASELSVCFCPCFTSPAQQLE